MGEGTAAEASLGDELPREGGRWKAEHTRNKQGPRVPEPPNREGKESGETQTEGADPKGENMEGEMSLGGGMQLRCGAICYSAHTRTPARATPHACSTHPLARIA